MSKSTTQSAAQRAATPIIGAMAKSAIGGAIEKFSKPLLPWKEMESHAQQFIDMLRRNATLREVKSLKPMDGLTLIALVSMLERQDRNRALRIMQSEGGKKTALHRKKSALDRGAKICAEANKLLKGGTSDRDLVSKLARKFALSGPTIRKALKDGGFKK